MFWKKCQCQLPVCDFSAWKFQTGLVLPLSQKTLFFFSSLKPVGTCTFYLEFKNSSQEIVLLNAVCVPRAALALDATEGGNIQMWQ